jgi:hypothetical protein
MMNCEPMVNGKARGATKITARPNVDSRREAAPSAEFPFGCKVVPATLLLVKTDMPEEAAALLLICGEAPGSHIDRSDVRSVAQVYTRVPPAEAKM